MPSLPDLAPEIRMIIYHHLLDDCVRSEERAVYAIDTKPLTKDPGYALNVSASSKDYSTGIAVDSPIPVYRQWGRAIAKCDKATAGHQESHLEGSHCRFIVKPQRFLAAFSHVNLKPFLALATTCKTFYREARPVAWENADITLQRELGEIYEAAAFIIAREIPDVIKFHIRTITLRFGHWWWRELRKVARILNEELPSLEHLAICTYITARGTPVSTLPRRVRKRLRKMSDSNFRSLGCLTVFDPRVTIEIKSSPSPKTLQDLSGPHRLAVFNAYVDDLHATYNKYLSMFRLKKERRQTARSKYVAASNDDSYMLETLDMRSLVIN